MAARVLTLPAHPVPVPPVRPDREVLGILGLGAAVLAERLVEELGEPSRPLVEDLVQKTTRWVAAEPVSVDDGLLVVESVVRSLLEPPASVDRHRRHLHLVPPAS